MNPVDPLDFVSRTVQAAAQFPEGRNWRALSKLSAAHPAVASYLESALDSLPQSVDSELISLTLAAWQISLEICPQLRKITSSHMIARENSGQTDWNILRSRGRAVQDFYRLYERFAPLKAISERLHLAQNEVQEKRFLICCKSILDAFREAARLSPRFSIRRSHEYEIRASLDDIAPEIWRTFRVTGAARISHLHEALQLV
ncbi:MAG TPA: hypothetical protein VLR94_10850, partial [Acidobacteriota bacterium]|nr:hypothetical protein [Acidobacteriota bacterium]